MWSIPGTDMGSVLEYQVACGWHQLEELMLLQTCCIYVISDVTDLVNKSLGEHLPVCIEPMRVAAYALQTHLCRFGF